LTAREAPLVPREVTDGEGLVWTCIQAFAGLGNDPEKQEAARVDGSDEVQVVCTPSGAARSRRLALPPDWETMDEPALLQALREG
jgi:hypothetical protein